MRPTKEAFWNIPNLPLILSPIHTVAVTLLVRVCGSGEMADTQVLGTCVFGRAGSSPASRTLVLIQALLTQILLSGRV